MELKQGYQQTEVGVIPKDWDCRTIGELNPFVTSGSRGWADYYAEYGDLFVRITNMQRESIYLDLSESKFVSVPELSAEGKRTSLMNGDVIVSITADIGISGYIDDSIPKPAYINQHIALIRFPDTQVDSKFISYFLASERVQKLFKGRSDQGAKAGMNLQSVRDIRIALPPKAEQEAIAKALSDMDALIQSLEQQIIKKQQIKQAAMQTLLTGKKRLEEFDKDLDYQESPLGKIPKDWHVTNLGIATICLDNQRVPLNESQRSKMRGSIPYCGANGVVDWVNDFVIDDDIILMAEDGGYFDEFATRPIAYRMVGKCWVNNHAHILKATKTYNQSYIFYSLVHKDIQRYLASGTRAKLNKSEMAKIEIVAPQCKEEQQAIADVLSGIDEAIGNLKEAMKKHQKLKQGMMQNLLTGTVRLV